MKQEAKGQREGWMKGASQRRRVRGEKFKSDSKKRRREEEFHSFLGGNLKFLDYISLKI